MLTQWVSATRGEYPSQKSNNSTIRIGVERQTSPLSVPTFSTRDVPIGSRETSPLSVPTFSIRDVPIGSRKTSPLSVPIFSTHDVPTMLHKISPQSVPTFSTRDVPIGSRYRSFFLSRFQ